MNEELYKAIKDYSSVDTYPIDFDSFEHRFDNVMNSLKWNLENNEKVGQGYSYSSFGYQDEAIYSKLRGMGYQVFPYDGMDGNGLYVAWNGNGAEIARRKATTPKILGFLGYFAVLSIVAMGITLIASTFIFGLNDDETIANQFAFSRTFLIFSGVLTVITAIATLMVEVIRWSGGSANKSVKYTAVIMISALMYLGVSVWFSKDLSAEANAIKTSGYKTDQKKIYIDDYTYDGDDNVLSYSETVDDDGKSTAMFLTDDGSIFRVHNITKITSTDESKPYVVYKVYTNATENHKKGEQKGNAVLYLPKGMHQKINTISGSN